MPLRPEPGDENWFLIPGRGESVRPPAECRHTSLELLGRDRGNNEFYRCDDCANVLVRKGSRDRRTIRAERERRSQRSDSTQSTGIDDRHQVTAVRQRPSDPTDVLDRLRNVGVRVREAASEFRLRIPGRWTGR